MRILANPTAPRGVGKLRGTGTFPIAARSALRDGKLRANLTNATATIRQKRSAVVSEVPDWQQLRDAASDIKDDVLANLDRYLIELERNVIDRGGTVHWARDANEANEIILNLVLARDVSEVLKVKSMLTQEIGLNEALESAGVVPIETDLAELIVQLGDDWPSHILVPAIHRNRTEIRDIFLREMAGVDIELTDSPVELAEAARRYLRSKFLTARVAISGVNFAVAETGTLCVVESEGNGRMCLTLPQTLISVMGVEKVIPRWQDMEVFLQILPRSSTGERMNPYTSMWAGAVEGQEFHLVIVDNGRTATLEDPDGRSTLRCIKCSACLNICPVYERVGGHAYGSIYPGPIGAVLSPQLTGVLDNDSLPFASTLCGACLDVCPVKIDIPSILVHLSTRVIEEKRSKSHRPSGERITMSLTAFVMSGWRRWRVAVWFVRLCRHIPGRSLLTRHIPGPLGRWGRFRDLPSILGDRKKTGGGVSK
jgi:L-lactate dehydrogenase complex protein LldF